VVSDDREITADAVRRVNNDEYIVMLLNGGRDGHLEQRVAKLKFSSVPRNSGFVSRQLA